MSEYKNGRPDTPPNIYKHGRLMTMKEMEIQRISKLSFDELKNECKPVSKELFDKVAELTKGIEVDLDEELPASISFLEQQLSERTEHLKSIAAHYQQEVSDHNATLVLLDAANEEATKRDALLDECAAEREMILERLMKVSKGKTVEPKLWASNFHNSLKHMALAEKLQARKG